jgi:hypothetical protein
MIIIRFSIDETNIFIASVRNIERNYYRLHLKGHKLEFFNLYGSSINRHMYMNLDTKEKTPTSKSKINREKIVFYNIDSSILS